MRAIRLHRERARTAALFTVASALLGSAAITTTVSAQEQVLAGIRSALDQMEEAYWTGDTELMLGVLTDDAILLPPGQDAIIGRAALEERYTRLFADRRARIAMEFDELRVADGWALIVGSTNNPGEDGTTKFLIVFDRAADGSWKLSRLIWNDNPDD